MHTEILREFHRGETRVLVDSPPGAGKTYLVEQTAGTAFENSRWRVGVGTHTKNQRDDFALRFRHRFPTIPLQVILSSTEITPPQLAQAGVVSVSSFNQMQHRPGVTVSTVDRHFYGVMQVPDGALGLYDLIATDEAYQIQFMKGFPLDALAPRRLMVGDPGQIAPFTELDTEMFESAHDHVLWSLPAEMLLREPNIKRFNIGSSRRLAPDSVRIIQPAFYPNLPFTATSTDAERRLTFLAAGIGDRIDRAFDAISAGASIVAIQLPDIGYELEIDSELSDLAVDVASRLRQRAAFWTHGRHLLDINDDLFYIDSHVGSGTEARAKFLRANIGLLADTPNVIQGRETLVTIVKHPLSSLQETDPFHLDPGRLCVMLTRHQLACIILVRGDVGKMLDDYEHDCGERLVGREDIVWRGFSTHQRLWAALRSGNRIFL